MVEVEVKFGQLRYVIQLTSDEKFLRHVMLLVFEVVVFVFHVHGFTMIAKHIRPSAFRQP